jgi:hypothetical protein
LPTIHPHTTKANTLALLQALVTGLQSQLPSGTFTLESTAFTTASLATLIQGIIGALKSLDAAQLNARAALTTARAAVAQNGPILSALKRNLLSMYGNAPQTLAIFGLKPPKAKVPKTVEQKAVAAAKARATRLARGTASKKAKAAIKGNVVGVDLTPITAPATPGAAKPPIEASPTSPSTQPVSVAPVVPVSPTGPSGK